MIVVAMTTKQPPSCSSECGFQVDIYLLVYAYTVAAEMIFNDN